MINPTFSILESVN